jgi:hypothetical protein
MSAATTDRSKIGRLPADIREEICRRIHNGAQGPKLLPWLNGLEAVKKLLAEEYAGVPVSDANLTAWRQSGYQEWLRRRERIDRTRELSRYAAEQSRANGASIATGAASIASGKLLEKLEKLDELTGQELSIKDLVALAQAIRSLRDADQEDLKLAQNERRLQQKDEELLLAREKYQRETCELFLRWHADKSALDAANSEATNSEKIERLGQLMFGETWQPAKK